MSTHDFVRDYGPLLGPLLGLTGVAVTLWVNARRADRTRRRELHAQAIGAVSAYIQMPYAIRRRRHEPEHASGERVRLTDTFREIQADLTSAEVLMRSDRDPLVRDAFATLVKTLRADAGGQASEAWQQAPIERDDQMGMGDLHDALARVRDEQKRFERIAAASSRPALRKLLGA